MIKFTKIVPGFVKWAERWPVFFWSVYLGTLAAAFAIDALTGNLSSEGDGVPWITIIWAAPAVALPLVVSLLHCLAIEYNRNAERRWKAKQVEARKARRESIEDESA